jgi:uncharacterized protein (TIGR00251 family)
VKRPRGGAGEAADGGTVIEVLVQPGSSRNDITGFHDGALRVRVAAPAEGGKANAAVARVLAGASGARPREVQIVSGGSTRRKRVRLPSSAAEALLLRWGSIDGAVLGGKGVERGQG